MKILFDTLLTVITNVINKLVNYKHNKELRYVCDSVPVVTMGAAICFLFYVCSFIIHTNTNHLLLSHCQQYTIRVNNKRR